MTQPHDSALRQRVAELAGSHAGTALVAGWSAGEAVSWPLLPEVALAALCVADPPSGVRLSIIAAASSVAGGALTYGLATRGRIPPQPLTTPRMRRTVAEQTRDEGPRAVRHQPLAGIPYKVYAAQAGVSGAGLVPFVLASSRARGTRILAAGLVLSALGLAGSRYRRRYGAYLVTVGAGFTVALGLVVRSWRD
ncbi:hypothetical protein RIF23_05275 [Lipingzhangella sp. LS1_29]|uniref:Membrane protein DedA with SNARE-associated domain n=1 Tax=Lipingzhangella rawalii TaxID=2055835 RepID=A0ABU2H324_9ACTN|nr:hypothetical protein [Lipingzhangella rawalii]MDS1269701.1 hypothetical protein [Lipingzhangella rawalii]